MDKGGIVERSAKDVRLETFDSFKGVFSSAPIRLMSRTVSAMRAMGYNDLASAIGDLDWQTVPEDDPEDPNLHHDWQNLLDGAFSHVDGWLNQLGAHPLGYNLDSIGFPAVTGAWSGLWSKQLGIDFANEPHSPPEIVVFHGGNQALQASLLGVAEARRNRVGDNSPATVLVPIPTFSCPMDQMALQGMQVFFLPPGREDMDPQADDLAQVPDGVDIDGVYLMPVNNPTGRTLPPEQMRAFVDAVLDRWPHAGIILDSVYVRLHPQYRELLAWYPENARYQEAVLFIDSLSKTHGVTGLRAGAILTKSNALRDGITRYAQNIMAGPSNVMQAVMLSLLAPFALGDDELAEHRIRLSQRIGRHLQRRRRLLMHQAFDRFGQFMAEEQPLLPDPENFDWQGSMYAVPKLSPQCCQMAEESQVSPTVSFYLETGIGGVPLDGFCRNPNLERHGLVVNADSKRLEAFLEESRKYVRLSFGMTPPPREP
ncbi:MAG: pyridoxal phosphate-dependent aminotransferase [Acidobacteriota bacterium]|nr:pyridoxal phosphate-dependent aminotransferase [Acidobacteriota bacterium]